MKRTTTCREIASAALATLIGGWLPIGGAMMLDTCFGLEVAGQKNETEVVKIENTAVKVEATVNVGAGAQGRDDSAGQPGRTEYPGHVLVCAPIGNGYMDCK